MSWRRLGVLIRQLPLEARTVRAVHGAAVEWDAQTHIAVAILETLQGANWQRGGGKGPRPKPIPRPGQELEVSTKTWGKAVPYDEAVEIFANWDKKEVTDGG